MLAFHFTRQAPQRVFVASEPQLNLAEDTYLNPDILVRPMAIPLAKVRGGDALLVVEVADSSLRFDLTTKAPIYAACGVREHWVIDAITLTTKVHRQPSGKAWGFMDEVAPSDTLTVSLAPALSVSLAALDLYLD